MNPRSSESTARPGRTQARAQDLKKVTPKKAPSPGNAPAPNKIAKKQQPKKRVFRKKNQPEQSTTAIRAKSVPAQIGAMDYTYFMLVLVLVVVGLIMMFSASYPTALARYDDSFHYIKRQLLFAVVGVVVMVIVSHIPFQILHRFALALYGGSVVLLVLVLFTGRINGVRRWISFGDIISFQPSEVAKFAIIVLFAHLISMNYEKMKDPRYGIWPFMALLGLVSILMVMEPHLSGTILIIGIGIVMMFVGGSDLKWFMLGGVAVAGLIAVVILMPNLIPYAGDRIEHWTNPWKDPRGQGYQTCQSLMAIGSGGLFGVGIGNSRQKNLYLPEPQNDFVFAIVCEELGLIGATLIILIFVLLVWRGYVIAMRCRDRFGSMLAIGLVTQVALQTILNIAVVTNTIPNTGISLPFFSYGGTSLLMLLGQMGFVLSVSRQTAVEKLE